MATARPASPTTTEPSDNECSVCNELFTVPKLLPCGHVLCRHCLVTWLQSQPQAHCPLCRCPIMEPGKAASASNNWDVVADGFPTDLAIVELVEAERLLNKEHQCCFCEDATATCLCLDCNDLFCASCKNGHTNQKMSRHHSVQDLTSLKADQLASQRPSPCPAHADKACELYCPSHDASMCTVCFASRHRSCPDVTDLQQKADKSRAVLQQLATKLAEAEKKLDQGLFELDQHLQDKEKKSKASLAELKAACNRLKSAIDAYYIRVEQEVEEDRSDVNKKVNEDKACLSQRRGRVTSERGVMKRVQIMKKRDAIISMTSVMEKRINDLDLCGTFSDSIKVIEHKTLLVNEGIEKQILQQLPNVGTFATQLTKEDLSAAQCQSAGQLCSMPFGHPSPFQGHTYSPYYYNQVVRNRPIFPSTLAPSYANEGPDWCFHSNRGQNILLSNVSLTAERRGKYDGGGIVLGNNPMAVDCLYEIQLVSRLGSRNKEQYMFVGVITKASADTIELPNTNFGFHSWTEGVVIRPDRVHIYGQETRTMVGAKLKNLPENDRVGVLLDCRRALHFYWNGKDQGVAAPNMPDPCWPMFELCGPYREV